jgi:acyl-CoA thioesterase
MTEHDGQHLPAQATQQSPDQPTHESPASAAAIAWASSQPSARQGLQMSEQASQQLAERVAKALYVNDKTSQTLGIRILEVRPGYARLAMVVRADMVNGHRVCHGGMVFTLADSAFAFACNSYNDNTVAAAASIDFLTPSREGDELTANASEVWRSRRNGIYEVTVTNQEGARIALFRGRSARIDGHVVNID